MKSLKTIRVLLIEDDDDYAGFVEAVLKTYPHADFQTLRANRLENALRFLQTAAFDIVVTDLGLPDSEGAQTFQRLREKAGAVPILVLTSSDDEGLALSAVDHGAQGFIVKSEIQARALPRTVYQIACRQVDNGQPRRGVVWGIVGAKGGVGTSTLAVNLAAAMALAGRETMLVDFSRSCSGASQYLSAAIETDLAPVLDLDLGNGDPLAIRNTLAALLPKCRLLNAQTHASAERDLAADESAAIVRASALMAEVVLLDLPPWPLDPHIAALEGCDSMLMVVDREPSALQAAGKVLDHLRSRFPSVHALGAVITNRTTMEAAPPVNEIQETLSMESLAVIPPAAGHLASSLRSRSPLVYSKPESNFSVAVKELAESLLQKAVRP